MFSLSKRLFPALFLFFLTFSPACGSEWSLLSDRLNPKQIPLPETLTSRHALTPSMTFWQGYFYLAWTEPDNHGIQQIYIKRLKDGMVWETFGKSQNKDISFSSSTPFIGTNGKTLFLAWTEKSIENVSRLYVKQWNGSEWIFLGGSLNLSPEKEAKSPILAFLNETPYLAWNESGEKEWSKLFVKHWDGKSWVSDGSGFGLENQHITQAPFFLFEGNKGHLVWAEADETRIFKIQYATLADGKWNQLHSPLNQDLKMQAFNPSLAFLKNDLYLVFQEKSPEGGFKIQLRRMIEEKWESQNEKLVDHGLRSFNPVLASDHQTLLIAWEEWDSSGMPRIGVQVITEHGESKLISPPSNGTERFELNPLLITHNQSAYLAWKETTDNDLYQIQIRRYSP